MTNVSIYSDFIVRYPLNDPDRKDKGEKPSKKDVEQKVCWCVHSYTVFDSSFSWFEFSFA